MRLGWSSVRGHDKYRFKPQLLYLALARWKTTRRWELCGIVPAIGEIPFSKVNSDVIRGCHFPVEGIVRSSHRRQLLVRSYFLGRNLLIDLVMAGSGDGVLFLNALLQSYRHWTYLFCCYGGHIVGFCCCCSAVGEEAFFSFVVYSLFFYYAYVPSGMEHLYAL
jgi:hypothetical protein